MVKADGLRAGLALAVGLLIPGIMAAQGWDDHDRSDRYNSVDSAKNLLNSCARTPSCSPTATTTPSRSGTPRR